MDYSKFSLNFSDSGHEYSYTLYSYKIKSVHYDLQVLELEDDSVGRLAVDIVKRNVQDEEVPSLTDKTFNSTKEANELMMTLFYLPCK